MRIISDNVKEIRLSKNIKQCNVAKSLNITPAAYSRKENGLRKFTIDEYRELAELFNVRIEELI